MSERLETLGRSESRGVCGAAVLARAMGGDALGRLQQVLVEIGLPKADVVASVQRGVNVSREAGVSALASFSMELEALGRVLAGNVGVLQLLSDWRFALSQRPSLSEERLALGYLCRFVNGPATPSRAVVAVAHAVSAVPLASPAANTVCIVSDREDSVRSEREAKSEVAQPETDSAEQEMAIPVADPAGAKYAAVEELNSRFSADLAVTAADDFALTFPA